MRKQDGSAETGHEPCHVVVVDKVDGEAAELDTRTDEAKQLVASVRDCEDTELPAHLETWVIKGVGSLHESQDAPPAPREGYRERQLLIVDEEMEDQNDLLELVDEMSR
ncbi:hypothetical protein ACO22_04988 [Paracoccidioides brasiliensis]|uniref:Uncharacterized protein n=1 Tax=Paracoccidioides brasiliensis TaxID=121759 RepID=A0A1D2JBQ3_PARBR|nr:hypothetical protein ACO22_04988 [Paracoccidioides brasiliensis]